MKIAYFVNRHPAISQTFIRREIKALEESGVSVVRYALRRPTETMIDPEDIEELKKTTYILDTGPTKLLFNAALGFIQQPIRMVQVLRLALKIGSNSDRGLLRNLAYAVEALALAKRSLRDHVGHIHAHFGTNSAAIAMLSSEISSIPFSFTVHGPEEFEKNVTISLQEKLTRARFVVCISSFGKSQMMRWSPVEQWHKIFVVRCGVPFAELARRSLPISGEHRLVCVGRLDQEKAQLVLIQAAARVRELITDFKIVLVGDGVMRTALEETVRQAGLEQHFVFTGWASGDRVKDEVSAARALVLPSFSEGLPVVLMEAMALGRPVIATYVAGIPELVQPSKNGWLVPAGDDVALANAMLEALSLSIDRLTDMGTAGLTAVSAMHDVTNEAKKLRILFQNSLSQTLARQ